MNVLFAINRFFKTFQKTVSIRFLSALSSLPSVIAAGRLDEDVVDTVGSFCEIGF